MKNMQKFNNEKYCWVYEMPMTGSFFILFEVWKVLLVAVVLMILLLNVPLAIIEHSWDSFAGMLLTSAVTLGILLVLSIPAYWIVIKANNGKYTVLFEMDEEGIDHIQVKTELAKALDQLVTMAGASAKNPVTVGAGLRSSSGTSLYSRFSKVRRLIGYPGKNLIRIKSRLINNQVYVDDEYFDFVWSYIIEHCPGVPAEIR